MNRRSIGVNIAAFTIFAVSMYPFLIMLVSSLKYQMQIYENPWFFSAPFHFTNYTIAFEQISRPIWHSIQVTAIGITVTVFASSTAAYAFARHEFPMKGFIYSMILMLLMIPGFVILVPQFINIKNMGLYNTILGQALPPAASYTAMGILLMRTFFEGLSKSLYEAAEIEGAKDSRIFTQIVLPLSKPILATVAIMSGLQIWNNFVWSLVVTTGDSVMPVILAITTVQSGVNEGDGVKLAGYIIASLPLLLLFFAATKPFISGLTQGAVKG
ncbi:carbohydrate ABC transporter permease [Paenibacillus sp. GCM10023248]|uniref:carbohydrate ABC transporter permease n=1 Tax=unclassified Paenibacillus TaxID=185978 RepID=UPI0023798A02|nr:carbohydrate ABC transporter permease [Paenibacillus sp. MAHUQ-63]MDD9269436.1 carbohydrate ABC transporter permease [Paenibacillus sp. MAHUQ-63]